MRPAGPLLRVVRLARLALRGALAGLMREVALLSLATLLMLAGIGCLLASGFALLVQALGVILALALAGVILLALAGLVLLLRRARPKVIVVEAPAPKPVPDPLAQMVFDLSFRLGQELTRPRK